MTNNFFPDFIFRGRADDKKTEDEDLSMSQYFNANNKIEVIENNNSTSVLF